MTIEEPPIELSPAQIRTARTNAQTQAARAKQYYATNRVKSWADIEEVLSLRVPDHFKSQSWSYSSISTFCTYWSTSFQERLNVSIAPKNVKYTEKAVINKNVSTFGDLTLFPEQQGCFDQIIAKVLNGPLNGGLQDGYTGSGKMYIGAAIIAEAVKQNLHQRPDAFWRLHPFLITCPKGIMEKWRRVLEQAGLSKLLKTRQIYVMGDSAFSHAEGRMFCDEVVDFSLGEDNSTLTWKPQMVPILALIDESHRWIKKSSKRYKVLTALAKSSQRHKTLFFSATPMEKINDLQVYTNTFDTSFLDMRVDSNSFDAFASMLDNNPNKPNQAACKRAREALSSHIFSIPYIKPKHKAINQVSLVEFESEEDRFIYKSAHDRYVEACQKSGQNTNWGRFEAFIELNNFRKISEPLRAASIARIIYENYSTNTYATAVGCAFKETIAAVAFLLNDKYGIHRDNISVVWGGRKEFKTQDIFSKEELKELARDKDKLAAALSTTANRRKIERSIKYIQDGEEHSETEDEQAYRHGKLREMRLTGKQSDNARQLEIDRFQDGSTRIVLFTNATGGIGLSFDRDKEQLLPRMGLFTPVYSGKEFAQVLGRLVRRASLSDAEQYIMMMRGTVEEHHVAPILDKKLRCIAEITNRSFDIVDLLSNSTPDEGTTKLRSKLEAIADAENDNTIATEVTNVIADEDDDDENED